jgi:predicted acyltransferase
MFWIVGAEEIVKALEKVGGGPVLEFFARQLTHRPWAGLAFYDLIFPLFVFIVGVSIVFSLSRSIEEAGREAAYKRIIVRSIVLFLLGILSYGGIANGFENVRLLGVLQRIALCYLFAGILFCTFGRRTLIAVCAGLLIAYWALMTFVPVPGVGAGNFNEGMNLANYLDKQYLPLRKWDGDHDPEGLLSTLPAIATCLLGVFAGMLLKDSRVDVQRKVYLLSAAGIIGLAVGHLWGLQFPIIKKIWTSSYVMVAGGYSCLLLALFVQVVDVWKSRKWAQPFIWIGMNPIAIYLAWELFPFRDLAERLVGGPIKTQLGNFGELLVSTAVLGLVFLLSWFLYRRKLFLRV